MKWMTLFFAILTLSGCMEQPALRIGALVLMPLFLVMLVFFLLNFRGGEEMWQEGRLPDDDDDNNEEHHLM